MKCSSGGGGELSCSYIECEVHRELPLHRDQLIHPLEIGFEMLEENELDNATIMDEQQERN